MEKTKKETLKSCNTSGDKRMIELFIWKNIMERLKTNHLHWGETNAQK